METIRLVIKQVPFYFTSFATLLIAMDQTGVLDRLLGPEMQTISMPMVEEAVEAGELEPMDIVPFIPFILDERIDLPTTSAPEPPLIPDEYIGIIIVTALVIGTIIGGYLLSRFWRSVTS
jgi:hypothetical protein